MNEKTSGVPDHVTRTLGREAQRNNILAARVIADIVKTTLGPKGMDKMLVDSAGNIIITNDGVTILEEMELDHPAAKLIVDIAKTQEHEVGDGTTTVAMLAGSLLEEAEKLLDRRIHPTVIIRGYERSAAMALLLAKEISKEADSKEVLKKIAMTAMTGKGAEGHKEKFAELIVEAVDKVANRREIDLSDIKIVKVLGEGAEKSELVEGIVVDKEITHADMPRKVEEARIALVDIPLEIRSPERETKISISSPEQLQSFLDAEEQFLREITNRIVQTGANVIFCQKGIDDAAQYYLAKAGIMAFRRMSRSDMEKISRATSAKIISALQELTQHSLGYAKFVEEIRQGEDGWVYVRGCRNPKAVSIILHGSTNHMLDEIERAMKDGLGVVASVVKDGRIVAGGGAIEIELARRLREFASTLSGREQLAAEAFANALETIPETLAENAGLDPIEIVTELRRRHGTGLVHDGLNLLNDKIEDCMTAGIIEPLKVKTQAISAATEVANMILRIDDVLVSSDKTQNALKTPIVDDE